MRLRATLGWGFCLVEATAVHRGAAAVGRRDTLVTYMDCFITGGTAVVVALRAEAAEAFGTEAAAVRVAEAMEAMVAS